MSEESYIKIIEEILDNEASKKTFDDPRTEIAWRIGYLTGMLNAIAENDFTIANLLSLHLQRLKLKRKNKN